MELISGLGVHLQIYQGMSDLTTLLRILQPWLGF